MSRQEPSFPRAAPSRSAAGPGARRAVFFALLAAAMMAPSGDVGPVAQQSGGQGFQPSQKIKADTVVDFPVDI